MWILREARRADGVDLGRMGILILGLFAVLLMAFPYKQHEAVQGMRLMLSRIERFSWIVIERPLQRYRLELLLCSLIWWSILAENRQGADLKQRSAAQDHFIRRGRVPLVGCYYHLIGLGIVRPSGRVNGFGN